MKILITGSKGFIGSACYEHFSNMGHVVYGCDIVENSQLLNYYQVENKNSNFASIFQNQQFDVCVNCSGAANVPDSFVDPMRDYTLNTQNVISILDAIRQFNPTCKFITLSSAAVYGNPKTLPVKESDSVMPISPYGMHKFYAEQICLEYSLHYKIQTLCIRIFSAFGPGLKKQLFWDLYQKARSEKAITLFGTGKETRDFIFIDDIVKAISLLAEKGNYNAGIYNLANGIQITIEQAVEQFLKAYDISRDYTFIQQQRTGDPLFWQADISRLKDLGFCAETTLLQGLKKYILWLHANEK